MMYSLVLVQLEIHLDEFSFMLAVLEEFEHRDGMAVVEHLVR